MAEQNVDVKSLIAALENENKDVRRKAADALIKIGPTVLTPFIQ